MTHTITGWTDWRNEKYIDICFENLDARCKALSELPPFPSFEEAKAKHYFKERYFEERAKRMDEIMDAYYKDNELEQLELEIRQTVIEEVRKSGYHFSGDTHQNSDRGTPIIDGIYIYCLSCRDWGELMYEAYPEEDYSMCEAMPYLKWSWRNKRLTELIPPR